MTLVNVTNKHGEKAKTKSKNPIVVLNNHGITPAMLNLLNFNLNGDLAVPVKLMDQGHDVWFLDTRGLPYSLQHDTKSAYEADFWDFTFEEMGLDIKAAVDFIYAQSGKKVAIQGYIAATTSIFTALTMNYDWFKERTYKVAMF